MPAKPSRPRAAKKPAPARPAAKKQPVPAAPSDVPRVTGSEADFQRHLPAAKKIAAAEVIPCRADVQLAHHNIVVGEEAIQPFLAELRKALPLLDLNAVVDLPRIARALAFAVARIEETTGDANTIAGYLARVRALRQLMMPAAEMLAVAGVFPVKTVEEIRKGRGSLDAAQDCVNLARLFRGHAAAIRGKTAVTAAHVEEAAEVGTELIARLKPKSAKRSRAAVGAAREAMEERDRLWTLLVRGHRDLRRAGMWLWVDEVDEHVPPLQARAGKPRAKKADKPAKPVTTDKPEKDTE